MANPSTVNPTASGKEVLRRQFAHALSNSTIQVDGVADHIYTLVSIVVCNLDNSNAEVISVYVDPDTGTDNIYLVNGTPLPASATWVFTEKIVWTNTDKLFVFTSTGDCDVYITYMDADFT